MVILCSENPPPGTDLAAGLARAGAGESCAAARASRARRCHCSTLNHMTRELALPSLCLSSVDVVLPVCEAQLSFSCFRLHAQDCVGSGARCAALARVRVPALTLSISGR
jgi:hypothetical protein